MVSSSLAGETKRILILNPYSRNVEPFSSAVSSFRSTLAREYRQPLDFQEIPLDLARSGGPEGEGPLVSFVEDRIRREPVELVVPIGSAGVQFAARHRERLFAESQILAVAAEPRMIPQDFLKRNATLVSQRANLAGFVEDILRVKPDTEQIAVAIGSSALEKYWAAECRKEFQRYDGRVNFTWLDELSYTDVMDRCSKLPPRSFILHVLFLMDKDGVSIEANEALKQLHQSANAPVFACFESEMGMGSVGGHLLENTRMGEMAARTAVQILGGRNAGDIPQEDLGEPIPKYDSRELRRWDIPVSRLPAGSVVMFKEPGFWEHYRWSVIGIASFVIIESVLILALLVNRRKRIQGEQEATLIADISSKFVNLPAEEVDREIIDAQRRICQFLELDSSVVWQVPEEATGHFNATHVYPLQDGPAALPPFREEDFPWVRSEMIAGRTVMFAKMTEMPTHAAKDRETVSKIGIKSTLTIPLSVGGEQVIGVLAFNALRRERTWSGSLVNRLELVAQIFANALARKRADRSLRESEERLSLAVNSAEAGLWVMDCHTFEFWSSEKARTLFGYSRDEEITLSRFKESVHAEDWAPVQQSLDRAMLTGEPINVEYRIRLGDGRDGSLPAGGPAPWRMASRSDSRDFPWTFPSASARRSKCGNCRSPWSKARSRSLSPIWKAGMGSSARCRVTRWPNASARIPAS
jgi:PAS domain S-box-containing protein